MITRTITIELLRDGLPTGTTYEGKLVDSGTYYFDIPREDLTNWNAPCIKVTVDYTNEEP